MKRAIFIALLGAAGAACGGGPCGDAQCGGNPVGSWELIGYCNLSFAGCPTSRVENIEVPTLMVVFAPDGSYALDVSGSIGNRITYPPECLSQSLTACGALDFSNGTSAQTCEGDPRSAGCACSLFTSLSERTVGTYRVVGSELTVTSNGSAVTQLFCVEGDLLRTRTISSGVVYRRR